MMPQMLHDLAYLTVLAFTNGDAQPRIAGHLPVELGRHFSIANPIDGNAIGKPWQGFWIDLSLYTNPVFAAPPCAGKLEMPRQIAIIGQQQQPLGVKIEPANRQHPRHGVRKRVKDGLPPFVIPRGDDQATRFVIAPQACWLARRKRLAVDSDAVGRADVQRGTCHDLAIDCDPAIFNSLLGFTARTYTSARDMFGDPFRCGRGVEGKGGFVAHTARVTRNSDALQIAGVYATRSA